VTLAWPEQRAADTYVLQIRDGERVVYERRLARPYLEEDFALVDGRRYTWQVFLLGRSHSAASQPYANGSFVLGG
jgi:hypothetical protein